MKAFGSLGVTLGSSEGHEFLCFLFLPSGRPLSTVSVFLIPSILYYFSLPGEEKCLDLPRWCFLAICKAYPWSGFSL